MSEKPTSLPTNSIWKVHSSTVFRLSEFQEETGVTAQLYSGRRNQASALGRGALASPKDKHLSTHWLWISMDTGLVLILSPFCNKLYRKSGLFGQSYPVDLSKSPMDALLVVILNSSMHFNMTVLFIGQILPLLLLLNTAAPSRMNESVRLLQ